MIKKIILTGSFLTVVGLLLAFTIPALAHGLNTDEPTSNDNESWNEMYEACQSGDWEAMEEAAGQVHGEDYDDMPCYDDYNGTPEENGETYGESWNETGNYTGGGMMGGGMMGW